MSPTEIQEVVTGLSGSYDKLYADGLHIAGEKYVLTKAEDRSLYARKVSSFYALTLLSSPSQLTPEYLDNTNTFNRAEKASSSSRLHKLSS